MKNQTYLYPLWVRIWHLSNALLFLALLITGLSLQYASEYRLIPFNLAVSVHNITGIAMTIIFAFYIAGNRFTSNGNYYQFHIKGMIGRVMKQFMYYSFGIFKKENPPFPITIDRKFNPLQKISYVGVMYFLVPIVILTGIALFFPDLIPINLLGISGVHLIALIHIFTGFALSIFMVIHIYFCTIGKTPSANFKSMITGWH